MTPASSSTSERLNPTEPPPESRETPAPDKSGARVRSMFAAIAHRYDFLNHFLSFNIDRRWRRFTVRKVPPKPGVPVLDCCTGTADLAIAYDRAAKGKTLVIGTDFCRPMLQIGQSKKKDRRRPASGQFHLVESDTQILPFPNDRFGVVTVAFGLRNIADTVNGLDEMIRVTRPGGQLAILEFSKPQGPVLGRLYWLFFRHVLPRVGQALAPNQFKAYGYLPATVLEFPDGPEMVALLQSRGLIQVQLFPLTFGVATLYVGTKPGPEHDQQAPPEESGA